MVLLICLAVLAVIMVVAVMYYKSLGGKRDQEMKAFADKTGFDFTEKGTGSLVRLFSTVHLFQTGRKAEERNVLSKTDGPLHTTILDAAWYEKKDGGSSYEMNPSSIETLICFESREMNLPDFVCVPSGRLTRFEQGEQMVSQGEFVGYYKVDHDPYSDFARKYVLYGRNKKIVDGLFEKSGIPKACLAAEEVSVEANGNYLVVYKPRQEIPIESLQAFYENAQKIYTRLKKASELPTA